MAAVREVVLVDSQNCSPSTMYDIHQYGDLNPTRSLADLDLDRISARGHMYVQPLTYFQRRRD